jgi:hypothetical protein
MTKKKIKDLETFNNRIVRTANWKRGPGTKKKEQGTMNRDRGPGTGEQEQGMTNCEVCEQSHNSALSLDKKGTGGKVAKQKLFLEAYRNSLFNVTKSCEKVGVPRRTFYNWKEHPDFVEQLNDVENELKDFIKDKLLQLVEAGNLIATIFCAKVFCGYVEPTGKQRIEIEQIPHDKETVDRVVNAYQLSIQTENEFPVPSRTLIE